MVGAVVLKGLVFLLVLRGAVSAAMNTTDSGLMGTETNSVISTVQSTTSQQSLSPLPSSQALLFLPSSQVLSPLPSSQFLPSLPSSQALSSLPSSQALSSLPSSQALLPLPSSQFLPSLPSSQALSSLPSSQAVSSLPSSQSFSPLSSSSSQPLPITIVTTSLVPSMPPKNQNIAILAGAVGGAGGLVVCIFTVIIVVIVAVALSTCKRRKKEVLLYQVEDNTILSNPAYSPTEPGPTDDYQDTTDSLAAEPSAKLKHGTFSLTDVTVPLTFKTSPAQNSNDNTLPEPHSAPPSILLPSEEAKEAPSEDNEGSKPAVSNLEAQSDDQGLTTVSIPIPTVVTQEQSKAKHSPNRKAPPPPTHPKPVTSGKGPVGAVFEPETKTQDPPTENQGINPVTALDALISEMSKSKIQHSSRRKPPPPPIQPKPKPVSSKEHLNPSHDKEQTQGGSSALVNSPPSSPHDGQELSGQLESEPRLIAQDEPCSGALTSSYHSARDTALGKLAEEIQEQVPSTVF